MELEIKGIKPGDRKRVVHAYELIENLEEDSVSEERDEWLNGLLVIIKQLARKYPIHPVIGDLAMGYVMYGGRFGQVMLIMDRVKRAIGDISLWGFLGEAYFREEQLFLAYEHMSYYLENADDGEEEILPEYLPLYEVLEPEYEKAYGEFVGEMGIDPEDQKDHERAQILMNGGRLDEALKILTRLVGKYPHAPSMLNNLGILYLNSGRYDKADELFQGVLSADPGNGFALGQSARMALYSGDEQKAAGLIERLTAVGDRTIHIYCELIQLHAMTGRDEAVLSLYEEYCDKFPDWEDRESLIIMFFGGIALLRGGNRKGGLKVLRKNRKINNYLNKLPEVNLDDLEKPGEEQNGPAYFSLHNLFPLFVVEELMKLDRSLSDEKFKKVLSKYRKLFSAMLPAALRGGDEYLREWYADMYGLTGWDEMAGPFYEFMVGPVGSDELRRKIFQKLRSHGKAANEVEMYHGGEKTVIRDIKVTEEVRDEQFTREQRELNNRAFYHLQDGEARKAADLWESYLEDNEEDPTILNNLGAAYEMLGLTDKRDGITKRLGDKYPDYFFYRVFQARECMDRGDFKQARVIIDAIGGEDEYHVSEMKALCNLNIAYFFEQKDFEHALQWYKSAAFFLPHDPDFKEPERLESLALLKGMQDKLGSRMR